MMPSLSVHPVQAPVQSAPFDLLEVLVQALEKADLPVQEGDILAISSKYVAISEGRIVDLAQVVVSPQAQALAERYHMDARMAQLVVQEAEHIFGGIPLGFLLTARQGVISPNAGIDRSNIPQGQAVLLPADAYASARQIRQALTERLGVKLGIILTDSWLMPGRWGTTGVAVGMAGFYPIQDERGKLDLFGNPMAVTQRGMADALCNAAQIVMGERDESTPFALLRGAPVSMTDADISVSDVAIDWDLCIYVESLTLGLLPTGAPRESKSAQWTPRNPSGV